MSSTLPRYSWQTSERYCPEKSKHEDDCIVRRIELKCASCMGKGCQTCNGTGMDIDFVCTGRKPEAM